MYHICFLPSVCSYYKHQSTFSDHLQGDNDLLRWSIQSCCFEEKEVAMVVVEIKSYLIAGL